MKTLSTVLLLVFGGAATAAGGWYGASLPDISVDQRVTARSNRPDRFEISAQGQTYVEPVAKLRALGLVRVAAAQAVEKPPELDPATALRKVISAVVKDGRSYVAVILAPEGPNGRARKKKGDAFLEGWIFDRISPAEIVLRKGKEQIALPVMTLGLPAPPPEPAPEPAPPPT